MPELPEVETIRRDLQGEVVGRKIKSVEVRNGRTVRRHPSAKQFRSLLEGHSIKSIDRAGKYLLLGLDDGATLVVHLGMSGQLQRVKSLKEPKVPHTHAVITFTQGGQLRFVDPRTFGELFVSAAPEDGKPALPELAHLGFDPLEDVMSWEKFWVLLSQHKGGLKALLMDQEFVAGIGNMYADEILFAAGLRYDRAADSLLLPGGAASLPGDGRDAGRSGQAARLLARGRAVPRPLRGGRRLPGPAPGLRPGGPGLPPLPIDHRARQVRRALDVLLRALPGLISADLGSGRRTSRWRTPPGRVSGRCS